MRAAVDGGVGADLAVVADDHAAQLRHLDPAAGFHRQAEAVGAEHGARMHAHALAEAHARDQGDARDQLAAGADDAVLADHAARRRCTAPASMRLRAPMLTNGADAGVGGDRRASAVDDGGGMDAGHGAAARLEQRGDAREGGVGIARDQRGAGVAVGVLGAQDHDAGAAVGQLRAVVRVGEEGELRRAGAPASVPTP